MIKKKIEIEDFDEIQDDNIDIDLDSIIDSLSEDEELLIEDDIDGYDDGMNDEEKNDPRDELFKHFKLSNNKHKIDGTHSLKRDTIFHGKINEDTDELIPDFHKLEQTSYDNFIVDRDLSYNDNYSSPKNLAEDVYNCLYEFTEINFKSTRRKPNRISFNNNYSMLIEHLGHKYSNSELFVEFSYYFTDNIFNMFKMLDKKYATCIIGELRKKGYLKNLKDINFV